LAHQLSQPLTAIGLQTETLKRGLNNSGGNQVYVLMLDKINSQLRKLTNLVKNLRQLFNSNIHDFHRIDLAFTINELLEIIDIEDTGSGIDIKMLPVMFELYKTSKKMVLELVYGYIKPSSINITVKFLHQMAKIAAQDLLFNYRLLEHPHD